MTRLTALKARLMKNPEFRAAYEEVKRENALYDELIKARAAAKLTQAEIAERMGTTQSAVARLEAGRGSPSIATLRKYAEATGTELKIAFVRPRAA